MRPAVKLLFDGAALKPALDPNFARDKTLDPRITYTNASGNRSYFDAAGVMQFAAANEPIFNHDPVTLECLGLAIWEARTNSIRNNTMVGAVAGSPGTLPTNWSVFSASGLTTTVVATGASKGINYVDLRFSGTSSATFYVIAMESVGAVAASASQVWTESIYAAIVGGSLANIVAVNTNIRQIGGAAPNGDVAMSLSSSLVRQPASTLTLVASATSVVSAIYINMANGAAIDFTLRIGLPQLELGAFATPVIPTSTVAVTRSADVCSITGTNFSDWYRPEEGTFVIRGACVNNFTGVTRRFAQVDDTTSLNRFVFGFSGASNTRFLTQVGGVSQADISGVAVAGNVTAIAATYEVNDFRQATGGTLGVADTVGTIPTVTHLRFGSDEGAASNSALNGHLQRLTYYPRRLSNPQLQRLSQ